MNYMLYHHFSNETEHTEFMSIVLKYIPIQI